VLADGLLDTKDKPPAISPRVITNCGEEVDTDIFKFSGARPVLGSISPQSRDIFSDDDIELSGTGCRNQSLIPWPLSSAATDSSIFEAINDVKAGGMSGSFAGPKLVVN
jgi:hypothetical protein